MFLLALLPTIPVWSGLRSFFCGSVCCIIGFQIAYATLNKVYFLLLPDLAIGINLIVWACRALRIVANMGTREMLGWFWRGVADLMLCSCIWFALYAVLHGRSTYKVVTFGFLFVVTGCMGVFLRCVPELPRRVQARIATTSFKVPAAAGIAAIVGNAKPLEVITKAEGRFRAVSLDCVIEAQFSSNTPVQEGLGLNQYTEQASLGHVDAFISHSWHDDAPSKWQALQRWRHSFKKTSWSRAHCVDR